MSTKKAYLKCKHNKVLAVKSFPPPVYWYKKKVVTAKGSLNTKMIHDGIVALGHQQRTYFLRKNNSIAFQIIIPTPHHGDGSGTDQKNLTRSPLLQALMFYFTEPRNWHMQTTHPEGHIQEGMERKMMVQMFCNLQWLPNHHGPRAPGRPGCVRPCFLVSDSQGPVAGWWLWQPADWLGQNPLEGHQLTGLGS